MNEVNCTSIRRGFDGGNRFGGLRHALHHKGDGCCGAMRSAYCTLRLLTGLGAAGWVLPPVVRRGELVCPGREAGRRASAAGPGMAHRRVPSDKGVNRGHPTQEGEQAGVAFLLVTFLWPRKEKSLAQARRAGETPSRTESSRPAWRSHANTLLQGNDVTEPLTLTLSRKGRGDGYRGRLRCANRPYVHIAPNASPVGERGLLPRTITLR
ncbi:hypothetical protein D3C71_1008770 [compost metagenome]